MTSVAPIEGRTQCRELAGNEVGVSLRGAKRQSNLQWKRTLPSGLLRCARNDEGGHAVTSAALNDEGQALNVCDLFHSAAGNDT